LSDKPTPHPPYPVIKTEDRGTVALVPYSLTSAIKNKKKRTASEIVKLDIHPRYLLAVYRR